MAANLYGQYVWLIDTIRSAGRIKKSEIDKRWAKSSLNEKKEATYPLRSFHRHKEAIQKMFGLIIGCDLTRGSYMYYISNFDELSSDGYRSNLLKSLEFSNQFMDTSSDIRRRIFFEPVNDGSSHLATIFAAMREKTALKLVFLPELRRPAMEVVPYCLKEKDHCWYLAAKDLHAIGNVETQVFSLRDVAALFVTSTKASMPRHFSGEIFFNSYFGQLSKAADKSRKKAPKDDPKDASKPDKKADKKPAKAAKPAKLTKPAPEQDPSSGQLSLF